MLQGLRRVGCFLALALATAAWAGPAASQDDGWRTLASAAVTSDLSCVGTGSIQITCFSTTTDGQIQQFNWTQGATGNLILWPKEWAASFAPDCLKIKQDLHCFYADRKGALIHATAGVHHLPTFENLGGIGMQGPPSCVSLVAPFIDCLARYDDGVVRHKFYRGSEGWSRREPLEGKVNSVPNCITNGLHAIDCFAGGERNELSQNAWNEEGGWTGWKSRGGGLSLRPECVSWAPGRIDCFVSGDKNGGAYHIAADETQWHNWEPQGGGFTGNLSCVARKENRLDCFVSGTIPGVHQESWDGTKWITWHSIGGRPNRAPECLSVAPDTIDCFISGYFHRMEHKRLTKLP
jgi:hypothetical protein